MFGAIFEEENTFRACSPELFARTHFCQRSRMAASKSPPTASMPKVPGCGTLLFLNKQSDRKRSMARLTTGFFFLLQSNSVCCPRISPMQLGRKPEPFDHPDWLYELKLDGFRALAYLEAGSCRLISRRNNGYKLFDPLCRALAETFAGIDAIFDGEVVCLAEDGRPQFYDLLRRRGEPVFFAFDILWLNGEDLRALSLLERKRRLRRLVPKKPAWLRYVDHFEEGTALYKLACRMDLEGIVAKKKSSPYTIERKARSWIKIKNPTYTQAEGRAELFERKTDHAPIR
jgi:ATP-dependent DNA ligase